MKQKLSGYLTIFLSLSLTMLLGVFFFLINAAFVNYSKMKLECATDIGMNAVLGEFHRELLERYDLLFIDLSYGSDSAGIASLENHLAHFIERNVRPAEYSVSSWNELELRNVRVTATLMAHHYDGRIFRRQACAYISENSRATMAADLLSLVGQAEALESQDPMSQWSDTMGEISTMLAAMTNEKRQEALARNPQADTDKISVSIDNPADESYDAARQMLDEWESSDSTSGSINLADYYSHRADGQNQPPGNYESSLMNEVATDVLFQDYLFEKMGYYDHLKEGSRLNYQLEYILMGADSDEKNLKKVKRRLFLWRLADNTRLYFADATKRAEATAIAAIAAALLLNPQLTPVIANSILFAWAYGESNDDVEKLLAGEKVPLVKVSLTSTVGGLSYGDYLGIMLLMQNENKKLARAMDVIEMDIRLTPGNRNFRIDWCVESFRATVDFRDRYENYAIDRRYGYY
jgi:hypothetical protein